MYKFTEQDLKEAAVFSKGIISRAEMLDPYAFELAKRGRKYFELLSVYDGVDHERQVNLIEYKLNELNLYGSVYGRNMTKREVFNELIDLIQNEYGRLFKEMIEIFRIRNR